MISVPTTRSTMLLARRSLTVPRTVKPPSSSGGPPPPRMATATVAYSSCSSPALRAARPAARRPQGGGRGAGRGQRGANRIRRERPSRWASSPSMAWPHSARCGDSRLTAQRSSRAAASSVGPSRNRRGLRRYNAIATAIGATRSTKKYGITPHSNGDGRSTLAAVWSWGSGPLDRVGGQRRGRCGRAAQQVAGEGGCGPADQCDEQGRDREVDDVVGEAVADRAADRVAAVGVGGSAAAEDGDRDGGVEQLQQSGGQGGQAGDAAARGRVAAPQGTGDADGGGYGEQGHSSLPAGREVVDLVDCGEPGQCECGQGREQAAEQAGQRDTGSAQERAGTEQVPEADEPDDREGDPATNTEPATSTELVVDGHPGVDIAALGGGQDCCALLRRVLTERVRRDPRSSHGGRR